MLLLQLFSLSGGSRGSPIDVRRGFFKGLYLCFAPTPFNTHDEVGHILN